jgi:hypothetical protein
MNIQKKIEDLGSIECFISEDNSIKFFEFKNHKDELILFYETTKCNSILAINTVEYSYEIIKDSDSDSIHKIKEFSQNIINDVFKKHPLISSVLNQVIEIESISSGVYGIIKDLESLMSLIKKLSDRDILRHMKNYGFSFLDRSKFLSDSLVSYYNNENIFLPRITSFELLDDEIQHIVTTQKAKRLIQKVYGVKHKNKKNEKTLNIFMILVEKNVSLHDIKINFSSKIATFKDVDDANDRLRKYINELSGWSLNSFLEKLKNTYISDYIVHKNTVVVKIRDYETSKCIGSGQWCISYDNHYFSQYKKEDNAIYFIFDFNKDQDDIKSMCGVVLNGDAEKTIGHWRDDSMVNDLEMNFEECFNLLPSRFNNKDITENNYDSLCLIDNEVSRSRMTINILDQDIGLDVLNIMIENKKLTKEFIQVMCKDVIYKYSKLYRDHDDDLNKIKNMDLAINKYLNYVDIILDGDLSLCMMLLSEKKWDLLSICLNKLDQNILLTKLISLSSYQHQDNEDDNIKFISILFQKSLQCDKNYLFDDNKLACILASLVSYSKIDMTIFCSQIIDINHGKCKLLPLIRIMVESNSHEDILLEKKKNACETVIRIGIDRLSNSSLIDQINNNKELFETLNKELKKTINKKLEYKTLTI